MLRNIDKQGLALRIQIGVRKQGMIRRVDRSQVRFCLFIGGLLVLLSQQAARAQVAATVSGRVQDASGATVPGVMVTVKSLETGSARVVTTDEGGNFRVLSLAVGKYDVKAEKTGFKAALREGHPSCGRSGSRGDICGSRLAKLSSR